MPARFLHCALNRTWLGGTCVYDRSIINSSQSWQLAYSDTIKVHTEIMCSTCIYLPSFSLSSKWFFQKVFPGFCEGHHIYSTYRRSCVIEVLEHDSHTPFPSCDQCKAKWVESGVKKAVKDVKWHLMKCRKDVADLVCFVCCLAVDCMRFRFCQWYMHVYIYRTPDSTNLAMLCVEPNYMGLPTGSVSPWRGDLLTWSLKMGCAKNTSYT